MSPAYNKSKSVPTEPVNYEPMVNDLSRKFGSLIRQLGWNNSKGTTRHAFEVDFAYAIHEFKTSPRYIEWKGFEAISSIVSELSARLKEEKHV